MTMSLKGRHKCIERNLESDCPICGEFMFTSTSTIIFMPCGHCMHHRCHRQYTNTAFQCPTCLKALGDMTDYYRRIDESLIQDKMPEEYNDTYCNIYCNECEKKSVAKYHFLYHKCGHCFGYNTKKMETLSELPKNSIIAPPISTAGIIDYIMPAGHQLFRQLVDVAASNSDDSEDSNELSQQNVPTNWCHLCQVQC